MAKSCSIGPERSVRRASYADDVDEVRPSSEVAADVASALMPPWFQALKIVADQWWVRHQARTNDMLREIAEGTGVEQLASALERDPVVESMLLDGVEAASRTGLHAKRRLLARVITEAVLDDAKVDESLLYVQTLRELDAIHLRALERLVRVEDRLIAMDSEQQRIHWYDPHSTFDSEPTPVQGALVRTGCVRQPSNMISAGVSRASMEFGRDLLGHIREFDIDGQVAGDVEPR